MPGSTVLLDSFSIPDCLFSSLTSLSPFPLGCKTGIHGVYQSKGGFCIANVFMISFLSGEAWYERACRSGRTKSAMRRILGSRILEP
jgi:hypothetical protein